MSLHGSGNGLPPAANDEYEYGAPKSGFFGKFEMVPGMHRPKLVRNGAIFLLLVGIFLYAGYTRTIPLLPKGGETVKAQFIDASNVRAGNKVRIAGVDVGKVESVDTVGEGAKRLAEVKMRVDKDKAKLLRQDAGARVWWRTLLGRNIYIELDPGSSSRELSGTIPPSRTGTQVEFDQALQPLNTTGRKAMREMFKTFGQGMQGPALRQVIDELAPAARQIAPGLGAMRGEHTGDLGRLVKGAEKVTRALARDERALGGLINGAQVTLGVTAARRADLAATLRRSPEAMRVAQSELAALRGTLDRLDPVARDMRPGARVLARASTAAAPALTSLKSLLRQADPLLANLRPAFRKLRSAGRAGVPMMAKLDPTVDRMNAEILPWLLSKDPASKRQVYQLIGPFFAGLSSITGQMDHYGHQVRFQAGSGMRGLHGILRCEQLFTDPNAQEKLVCSDFSSAMAKLFGARPAAKGARR